MHNLQRLMCLLTCRKDARFGHVYQSWTALRAQAVVLGDLPSGFQRRRPRGGSDVCHANAPTATAIAQRMARTVRLCLILGDAPTLRSRRPEGKAHR